MKALLLIISILLLWVGPIKAQQISSSKGQSFLGIGVGLPFGGIGGKLSYNAADQLNLFGGLGYNLIGIGANAGFQYSFPSKNPTEFYITGMYGYNSVIVIKNLPDMGGSYNGPSFGAGLKINSIIKQGAYWDVGLLVPSRSNKFKNDLQAIERSSHIKLESKPWPVLFYFGYNFMISQK